MKEDLPQTPTNAGNLRCWHISIKLPKHRFIFIQLLQQHAIIDAMKIFGGLWEADQVPHAKRGSKWMIHMYVYI